MGGVIGLFARTVYFKKASRGLLIFAAFLGCLMGLLAGWIITGQDGNMLNYGLALVSCSAFVFFAGIASLKKNKSTNKKSA